MTGPWMMVVLALSACTEGSDDGPMNAFMPDVRELTVDATDPDVFTYVELDANEVVSLDAEGALTDVTWDLRFRGTTIHANGGASGPGGVGVGLVATPGGLYNLAGEPVPDEIRAAAPEDSFDLFTEEPTLPSPQLDDLVSVIADSFYNYDSGTGDLTENDTVGFLVRTADGANYARLRVTNIDFLTRSGKGVEDFTISVEPFSTETSTFGPAIEFSSALPDQGQLCFDLDAETEVPCFGDQWDMSFGYFGRTTFIHTNGGDVGPGQGGAVGPVPWDDLATYTSPLTDPGGTELVYDVDRITTLFDDLPWFVELPDGLWPNYRIYYIDPNDDGPAYILQILGDGDPASEGPLQLRSFAL